MHIETTAGQLKKALRLVKPVIPRWVRVPVLACVRITASGGAGRLDATDLDVFYSVDFAVIGHAPDGLAGGGAVFLIDHAVLLRLVSNLPTAEMVRLETAQEGEAVLRFRDARYRLPTMPADKWPELAPAEFEVWSGDVDQRFMDALRFCRPMISTEETRYYLNGVCLDGREMVATDGHRLASHASGVGLPDGVRPIIPRHAVNLMVSAGTIGRIELGKTWLRMHVPAGTISTKLIDGTFPDWRRLVGERNDGDAVSLMRVDLDRAEMREALTRLTALSGDATNRAAGLVLAAGRVALTSVNPDAGTGEEALRKASWLWVGPADERGDPMVASFNVYYLRDMLGVWRGNERVHMWLRYDRGDDRHGLPAYDGLGRPACVTRQGDAEPPAVQDGAADPLPRVIIMPMRFLRRLDGVVSEVASRLAARAADAGAALEAAE
ncbi:hypothetical protein [Stappia sp. WLB 29]|uniref:DNA polymerase III subunit beta n=1 Tax=Stappia sp. WLB 29 TaxID=2925220 RepID=UPI0020BFCCF5|nr:hypothetical protein [Stappia sp. WLB 29]